LDLWEATVQVTFTVVCSEDKFFKFITGAKDFFWYVIFVYKVDFKMFFFNPFLCVMEAQCFFCDVGDEFLSIT